MVYIKSLTNLRLPKYITLRGSCWFLTSETKVCLRLTNFVLLGFDSHSDMPGATFFLPSLDVGI
jgi:hypothetical protein